MSFQSKQIPQQIYKNYKTTGEFSFCKKINNNIPLQKDEWSITLNEAENIKTQAFDVIRCLDYEYSIEFKYDLIDYLTESSYIQDHSKYKIILGELIDYINSINKKRIFDFEKMLQAELNADINARSFRVSIWKKETSVKWMRKLNRHLEIEAGRTSILDSFLKEQISILESIYSKYIDIYILLYKYINEKYLFENIKADFKNYSTFIFAELKELENISLKICLSLDDTDKKTWDNTKSFFLLTIDAFIKHILVNHNNSFEKTNFYPELQKSRELLNNVNSDIFHKTDIIDEIPLVIQHHKALNKISKISLHVLIRDIKNERGSKTELNRIYYFLKEAKKHFPKINFVFDIYYNEYKSLISQAYELIPAEKEDSKLNKMSIDKFKEMLQENHDFQRF